MIDKEAVQMVLEQIRLQKDNVLSVKPQDEFIFYVKERLHCSNKIYNNLRLWLDLGYILEPINVFDKIKAIFNNEVWREFRYHLVGNCFVCSPVWLYPI